MTRVSTGDLPVLPAGAISGPPPPLGTIQAGARRLRWALNDVWVLTRRTLTRVMTTPEQLLNVTLQPLLFVLVFSYVFDGAIVLPHHGNYREYLVAGIFAVNMGGTAQGTAIGSPSTCPRGSSTGSGRCPCRAARCWRAGPWPTSC